MWNCLRPKLCPYSCALLPLARKRETQKFCLTPRLSLQLYYIRVLAPQVAGWGRGGGKWGFGGVREHLSRLGAGQGLLQPLIPWLQELGSACVGTWSWERPWGLQGHRHGPSGLNVARDRVSLGDSLPVASCH